MIQEYYISFETAKLLKEKGFAETSNTIGTYNDKGEFYLYKHEKGYNHNHLTSWYSAPTLQMVMKWLREKHKITIGTLFKRDRIYYEIHQNNEFVLGIDTSKSYEKACEEAIKYCLKILI